MAGSVVVAITGASGSPYAVRLIEVLLAAGRDVHLSISPAAVDVLRRELGLSVDLKAFTPAMVLPEGAAAGDEKIRAVRQLAGISSEQSSVLSVETGQPGTLRYYHYRDFRAPAASGSFLSEGMVVCPCSMGTLSAIVHGTSANLIHRAADVHLKERRRLILVPRETPLSLVHLDNMRLAAQAGAILLPAMPGFYHGVRRVQDLVDFVVGRICDQLGVAHTLVRRWGSGT